MPVHQWPAGFDFRSDETCQNVFKPFIERQLENLKIYDSQRPPGAAYIFHAHAKRVAEDVKNTCLYLNLGDAVAENMYWAVLPHDIGKQSLPPALWDLEEKPNDALKAQRRSHTQLGAEIAEAALAPCNHPFYDLMLDIMRYHHEQMDGQGYLKMPGHALSLPVRLASLVEAFDGWSVKRPHFGERDVGAAAVLERMRVEKAGQFDPDLLEAFAAVKLTGH